jgi:hypothetical protein
MWVKIDYSTQDKKNFRTNTEGQYTVYTKKHWWNKWTERDTYADIDWCKRDAEKLIKVPIYYFPIFK